MLKFAFYGAFTAMIALSFSAPANAEHGELSVEQVQALLPGATGYGTSSRGAAFQVKYFANGKMTISTGTNFSDRGKWWIEDGVYCSQWEKVRKGKKGCFVYFHKSGDDYHFEQTDGSSDGDVKIVK
jgi:hypothetical protein